jgi:hypothetical protein
LSVNYQRQRKPLLLEQFRFNRKAAQASMALYQHVEDFALVVDIRPEIHSLAGGRGVQPRL